MLIFQDVVPTSILFHLCTESLSMGSMISGKPDHMEVFPKSFYDRLLFTVYRKIVLKYRMKLSVFGRFPYSFFDFLYGSQDSVTLSDGGDVFFFDRSCNLISVR